MANRRRVMPRQALDAERHDPVCDTPWYVLFTDEGPGLHYTDAEFDAHFIDADLVQAVLDAADAVADWNGIDWPHEELYERVWTLQAAVRALRAARPEGDT